MLHLITRPLKKFQSPFPIPKILLLTIDYKRKDYFPLIESRHILFSRMYSMNGHHCLSFIIVSAVADKHRFIFMFEFDNKISVLF